MRRFELCVCSAGEIHALVKAWTEIGDPVEVRKLWAWAAHQRLRPALNAELNLSSAPVAAAVADAVRNELGESPEATAFDRVQTTSSGTAQFSEATMSRADVQHLLASLPLFAVDQLHGAQLMRPADSESARISATQLPSQLNPDVQRFIDVHLRPTLGPDMALGWLDATEYDWTPSGLPPQTVAHFMTRYVAPRSLPAYQLMCHANLLRAAVPN